MIRKCLDRQFLKQFKTGSLSVSLEMKEILRHGIISAASGYKDENEWVVDSNILNIPSSSILYIAGPTMKTKKLFQQLKKGELPKQYKHVLKYEQNKMNIIFKLIEKYGLDNKYKKIIMILGDDTAATLFEVQNNFSHVTF